MVVVPPGEKTGDQRASATANVVNRLEPLTNKVGSLARNDNVIYGLDIGVRQHWNLEVIATPKERRVSSVGNFCLVALQTRMDHLKGI